MNRRLFIGLLSGFAVLTACRVGTKFPAERVAQELRKMCAHDYKMSIDARHSGNNLQATFWRVGMLKPGQTEIQMDAAEALQRVLLCATRITLSSDAQIQFLEVKMADALTGASVTVWRFVPDIVDSMYVRMPEDEYNDRLVIEYNLDEEDPKREWKESRWDPPITLSQFLAKQIVLRIKRQSTVGLQAHEDLTDPFILTVVVDNWDSLDKQGAHQQDKVATLAEKTVRTVVTGYKYTGFRQFVLKAPNGLALKSWAL
jgi:hypothetical protein